MNFDLTDVEWHEVTGLTEGKHYVMQAKRGEQAFSTGTILFTQGTSVPTDLKESIVVSTTKFKKGSKNIYVRSFNASITINVCIQELEV